MGLEPSVKGTISNGTTQPSPPMSIDKLQVCRKNGLWPYLIEHIRKPNIIRSAYYEHVALCKAHVNFESETKSPPREHDFSSISRWIALKIEICTYLKISEVLLYSFSHEILSKKIVSDRVALNSRTQFRDNGGLLAFDM